MNKFVKIYVVIIPLFLVVFNASATGLKKGFEALNIFDYFKAKNIFEQSLKKHLTGASYGLSIIYARNNNPFYNLDSALIYIKKAANSFPLNTLKQQEKLKLLTIDSMAILKQRILIDSACFYRAKKINTINSYNFFISHNNHAIQHKKAIEIRNSLAYKIAQSAQTSVALKDFITKYPKAKQIAEAKARFEKVLFNEYISPNTLENNVKFITEQPNNYYVSKAEQNIYTLATKEKKIIDYYTFIKKFPTNPYVSKAWRNIYSLSTQVHSPKIIKRFLQKYPDYPFKNELAKDYVLANTPYYKMIKNNKWGFVNEQLKQVIPFKYDFVTNFKEGVAAVSYKNKVGFINKAGKTVIPFKYDEAESFSHGLAVVGINEKYGIINRTGEEIVPIMYNEIGDLNNKFIAVNLNNKYGFIDRKGNLTVGLKYETVGDFENGIAYVQQNNLYGIIDTNLFYIVKPKFQWIDNLTSNFIRIKIHHLYGVINRQGKFIVQPLYQQISELKNGLAIVVEANFYGYVNKQGKIVIKVKIPYQEGVLNWALFNNKKLARIITKQKFGLIDTLGNKFIPALFEDIGGISANLIAIKRHGKWGFCDYETKLKIPYNFESVSKFINGLSFVKSENKYGIIDEKGRYIIKPKYESITWFYKHILLVKLNNKYGLINLQEQEIIPLNYTKIEFTSDKKLLRLYLGNSFNYKSTLAVFGK